MGTGHVGQEPAVITVSAGWGSSVFFWQDCSAVFNHHTIIANTSLAFEKA